MGIYNHWGGAGDSGTRRYQGVYCPSLEHGRTIHCESSYHRLVSGGGEEAGDEYLTDMAVAACSRYPMDKSGKRGRRDGGGERYRIVGGREILGHGRAEEGQMIFGGEVINVTCNIIGTVPNAHLASDLGNKYHPPLILSKLGIHGGQVNREIMMCSLLVAVYQWDLWKILKRMKHDMLQMLMYQ